MFDEKQIIKLFENQWPKVNKKDIEHIFGTAGGISAFEGVLLYLYILSIRPRHVIEFSPNHGYSTFAIASAQRAMRNRWTFATFDIKQAFCQSTESQMLLHGLDEYCHVICGDAIEEVSKYIKEKGAHVDLCFIDSDHGAPFASKYIKKLFPLFQPGCLIGVHDIAGKSRDGSEFKTSLLGGAHKGGEEGPVREYIQSSQLDYTVLHSVTGGQHEGANLPVNNELYDKIKDISGYDFRKAKSPPCPKTLFFKI
jgi:cephalosporin hydroxylase